MNTTKTSLKYKLLIAISAMISISYLILGYNSLSNSYDNNYENLKQKEIELSSSSARYINDYLVSKVHIIESIAKQISKLNQEVRIKNYEIFYSVFSHYYYFVYLMGRYSVFANFKCN